MTAIRTDDQHPGTAMRDDVQRSGPALALRWADVRESGARECRRTGGFGTKEQE
jgi:hypothetical protein